MGERVDLYGSYRNFTERVMDEIRKETFGTDIGQNSWITLEEHARFVSWLKVGADGHVLEIASGSGGPALQVARTVGCRVTGVDVNADAVATATAMAGGCEEGRRVTFGVADAGRRLPFEDGAFDGLLCIDSMNHLPGRPAVLREWGRVLRAGGRAVFSDPVVVTGPVSNEELSLRSSIGFFLFVPSGVNERLIEESGLRLVHREDVSENAARIAERWHRAREARRDDLLQIEGEERFAGVQRFFGAVHRLTGERRLSRIVYVAEKPAK